MLNEVKWEDIPHDNGFYLRRAPVFGGWLVSAIDDVFSQVEQNDKYGYEWRTSLTFVPDVNHEWDLSKDYSPVNKKQP